MIHGRGDKPEIAALEGLWREALRAGIARDFPDRLPALKRTRIELVHYGDLARQVLAKKGRKYDEALDLADQRKALADLAARAKSKDFRREHYERLPGKTPIREFLADVGAPALAALGLKDRALGRYMPELVDYWRKDGTLRAADGRLLTALIAAFERGERVLLVSHCIGAVIAYNALRALSRGGVADGVFAERKVDVWLTLGAPLGDESVKQRLDGADVKGLERYPSNVVAWCNVAAEDDYVCHDETVENDYREMLAARLVSRIDDARIYNLALRYGRSNPHNALGYLVHPRVSRTVAEWLAAPSDAA
jgi:hypothetical protein